MRRLTMAEDPLRATAAFDYRRWGEPRVISHVLAWASYAQTAGMNGRLAVGPTSEVAALQEIRRAS
jgi:hypothetical protein